MVGRIQPIAIDQGQKKKWGKEGRLAWNDALGNEISEVRQTDAKNDQKEIGDPHSQAEDLQGYEVKKVRGGKGHLREVTVENLAIEHPGSIMEENDFVAAGPNGGEQANEEMEIEK